MNGYTFIDEVRFDYLYLEILLWTIVSWIHNKVLSLKKFFYSMFVDSEPYSRTNCFFSRELKWIYHFLCCLLRFWRVFKSIPWPMKLSGHRFFWICLVFIDRKKIQSVRCSWILIMMNTINNLQNFPIIHFKTWRVFVEQLLSTHLFKSYVCVCNMHIIRSKRSSLIKSGFSGILWFHQITQTLQSIVDSYRNSLCA